MFSEAQMYRDELEGIRIDLAHGVIDSLSPLQRYSLKLALDGQNHIEYFKGVLENQVKKDQRGE